MITETERVAFVTESHRELARLLDRQCELRYQLDEARSTVEHLELDLAHVAGKIDSARATLAANEALPRCPLHD